MGKTWEHMTELEKIEHLHADVKRTLRLFGQLRHTIMMEEQVTKLWLEHLFRRVEALERTNRPQAMSQGGSRSAATGADQTLRT
jgi:hypothetical protein